jgi:hypothetical protein
MLQTQKGRRGIGNYDTFCKSFGYNSRQGSGALLPKNAFTPIRSGPSEASKIKDQNSALNRRMYFEITADQFVKYSSLDNLGVQMNAKNYSQLKCTVSHSFILL